MFLAFFEYYMCMPSHSQTDLNTDVYCGHCACMCDDMTHIRMSMHDNIIPMRVCTVDYMYYARMHVNMKTVFIIMGEVIHVLNIMKCMDSDIMYIINVYNDIWNATPPPAEK